MQINVKDGSGLKRCFRVFVSASGIELRHSATQGYSNMTDVEKDLGRQDSWEADSMVSCPVMERNLEFSGI